jgi:hypothetical protein
MASHKCSAGAPNKQEDVAGALSLGVLQPNAAWGFGMNANLVRHVGPLAAQAAQ